MTNEPKEPNEHVDQTLRDAFPVDRGVAVRVSDRVLAAPPHPRRRASLAASLALAAVTLCAGLVAWLSRPPARPSPVTTAPAPVTELTGSFVDGVLSVSIPGDGVVIAGPGQRDDRPPEGSGVVLLEGDAR